MIDQTAIQAAIAALESSNALLRERMEVIASHTYELPTGDVYRSMDYCANEYKAVSTALACLRECAERRECAADVAPVVHGEWRLLDECSNAGVYCSVCHKAVFRESAWYKNVHIRSKHCPNCGAKMDGGT